MERRGQGGLWMKGDYIGRGSFGTVSMAKNSKNRSHLPRLMAVKWAEVSDSATLQKEREILNNLGGCPHILRCYGDELITEVEGQLTYNILLEYASGGSLASLIKNSQDGLPEAAVRRYTRSILQGLNFIHVHGYVHCDIKPQNILLVPCEPPSVDESDVEYVAKIGDFGSAKYTMEEQRKRRKVSHYLGLRGTPLYMSPESVSRRGQEPPSDIWALGCVVAEMISGKPAWNCKPDMDVDELFSLIGSSRELPETPSKMSKEGKDFLKRCFVKNSEFRWTAEMLLYHPFVSEVTNNTKEAGSVQLENLPVLLNYIKAPLWGKKRRRIYGFDEPSVGDERLKPVQKASMINRD